MSTGLGVRMWGVVLSSLGVSSGGQGFWPLKPAEGGCGLISGSIYQGECLLTPVNMEGLCLTSA